MWVSKDPSKAYYGEEVFVDESGKIVSVKRARRPSGPTTTITAKQADIVLPTVDLSKPRTAGDIIREWRKTPGVTYTRLREEAVRETKKIKPRVVERKSRRERADDITKRWKTDPDRIYEGLKKEAQ